MIISFINRHMRKKMYSLPEKAKMVGSYY